MKSARSVVVRLSSARAIVAFATVAACAAFHGVSREVIRPRRLCTESRAFSSAGIVWDSTLVFSTTFVTGSETQPK